MKRICLYSALAIILLNSNPVLSQETQVKQFFIQSSDPQALQSIVEHVLGPKGKVVYDSHTHSLVVIDTPGNLAKITKIIEEVDVSLKMVSVEVVIAEVSNNFVDKLGLQNTRFILPKMRFDTVINLLSEAKDSRITSKSTIRTLSNNPARMQATKDAVVAMARYIYFPSGSAVDIPVIESVGDTLEVLPLVNPDNTITLAIRPSMSTLDNSYTPYQRSISTEVVINNGDTLVLGGLNKQQVERSQDSTFLGLPLSSTQTEKNTNLVIFITANVIE